MSRLMILAASVFEISCGKIDRQKDRPTSAGENHSSATSVGAGSYGNSNNINI